MSIHRFTRVSTQTILTVAVLYCSPVSAFGHGDEDHGEAQTAASVGIAGSQGDVLITSGMSDYFEVVAKYPATDAGYDTRVRLYVADYATNQPIVNAALALA